MQVYFMDGPPPRQAWPSNGRKYGTEAAKNEANGFLSLSLSLSVFLYIYIYIYIYTQHSFLEALVSRSAHFYKGSRLEMNCATVEHA